MNAYNFTIGHRPFLCIASLLVFVGCSTPDFPKDSIPKEPFPAETYREFYSDLNMLWTASLQAISENNGLLTFKDKKSGLITFWLRAQPVKRITGYYLPAHWQLPPSVDSFVTLYIHSSVSKGKTALHLRAWSNAVAGGLDITHSFLRDVSRNCLCNATRTYRESAG